MSKYIDKFLNAFNVALAIAGIAYLYSMLAHPFLKGGWAYAHDVWLDWQSLNVGILAFGASVIAFNISKYQSDKQRARELVAARSFLPHALSDLCSYLRECAALLIDAYVFSANQAWPEGHVRRQWHPEIPEGYAEIFDKCIKLSDPPLSEYLSTIISKLQVNQSRLEDMATTLNGQDGPIIVNRDVLNQMLCIGEIQSLINTLFPYSRGEEELSKQPLTAKMLKTAFFNIRLHAYWDLRLESLANTRLANHRGSWHLP